MKRFITLATALLMLCALGACSQSPGSATNTPEPSQQPDVSPTIETTEPPSPEPPTPSPELQDTTEPQELFLTIPAPSLAHNLIGENTEQPISVYLPAGYETSGKDYPVLYFLPGFGDGNFVFMDYFASAMPEDAEMIVVIANGMGKLHGTFYSNSPITGNWEDYITHDLISYIDENYRTIPDSSARGLAGHSMGGFGVVNIVMHSSGLFDYAYSMSPGLFDENGLTKSAMNMSLIERRIEEYKDLSREEAAAAYQSYIQTISWPTDFSFAYGSVFAYDASAKAPYIKLPDKDADGEYIRGETWALYESGYGNLAEKVITYADNLKSLKRFAIEYGLQDNYQWIVEGCDYFSDLLTEQGIEHTLESFTGGHWSSARLRENVIPFFLEAFAGGE